MKHVTYSRAQLDILWLPDELPRTRRDRAQYLELCRSLSMEMVWTVIQSIAIHRWWIEDLTRTPVAAGAAWLGLTKEERHERTDRELLEFNALTAQLGENQGLTAWLEDPERATWPLAPGASAYTRVNFDAALAEERRKFEPIRSRDDRITMLWRRHTPGWRRTLSPNRANALDLLLAHHLPRLREHFAQHGPDIEPEQDAAA